MADVSQRFLQAYLKDNPVRATEAGDHQHDALWPDVSEAGEKAWLATLSKFAFELGTVDPSDPQEQVDKAILEAEIARQKWSIAEGKEAETNPLVYTGLIGDGLDPLLTREFAPVEVRARSLAARLRTLAPVLEAAKKRLKNPPELHTKTAIVQNKGLVELVKGAAKTLGKLPDAQKVEVEQAAEVAKEALEKFGRWLEEELLPTSKGDARLGRAKFEKKLRLVLDDPSIDVDAFAKEAEDHLAATRKEMVATSKELWPTLFKGKDVPKTDTPDDERKLVKAVLDELAKDRPTNATIVKEAAKMVEDATAFVKEKDLVRVPDEPCRVIEMPEYRRGVSIAYCDSSGPLEQKPETFYAISPTPKDWDAKRAESFYREYNRSMLVDLTVHEAMPGHFLQLSHNNKFPSKLRALFSSGAFVEGWAVYTEWLLSDLGFGGPKVKLMRQKMALRMAMNTVLDHAIHAGTMDEKQAVKRMMEDAFQEEGEAVGKWKRANLTSAQLTTYFYGFRAMMKLREEAKKKPGFSERSYHDKLLSFGSPPPRHLPKLVLGG